MGAEESTQKKKSESDIPTKGLSVIKSLVLGGSGVPVPVGPKLMKSGLKPQNNYVLKGGVLLGKPVGHLPFYKGHGNNGDSSESEDSDQVPDSDFFDPNPESKWSSGSTTTPMLIKAEDFDAAKLEFFKIYLDVDRWVDLEDALDSLKEILPSKAKSTVDRCYEDYKGDEAKVVTSIWTSDNGPASVYKIINAALILDGQNLLHLDQNGK